MSDDTTRHRSVLGATFAGMVDAFRPRTGVVDLDALDRLDGRTALVTGASRGLGKAIARQLAVRGATVWVACRSQLDETVRDLTGAGGPVRGVPIDLADPRSVADAVAALVEAGVRLDVLVLNAGVVPLSARTTAAGFDVMFHVNFLANVDLVDRLLTAGVLRPGTPAPRVVVVGSESHRSAGAVAFDGLGVPRSYGTREVVAEYGVTKLLLHTWAAELARRLDGEGDRVAVHHLCPGAIDSDIAREAPGWSKPLLRLVFKATFQAPEVAARPVTWLCASPAVAGRTGVYLHLDQEKACANAASDPVVGARLWDATRELLVRLRGA